MDARFALGFSDAIEVPSYETVAATGVPPGPASVNVEEVTVAAFNALLKLAATTWLTGTPTVPFAGVTEITAGAATVTLCLPHPVVDTGNRAEKNPTTPSLNVSITSLAMPLKSG